MVVTARIEKLEDGKLVLKPDTDISRFVEQKRPRRVEVRLDDGRTISVDQRRKIFAIIRDISLWSGHEPEELRQYLEWGFSALALMRGVVLPLGLRHDDSTRIHYLPDFILLPLGCSDKG